MPPYKATYHRGGDNVIGSAIPGPIHTLIDSMNWSESLADLSEQIINKQLELYAQAQRDASSRVVSHGSLLEQAAAKIVSSVTGPEDLKALMALPPQLARKTIWESENLEYAAFRMLRRALESESESEEKGDDASAAFVKHDMDEWILRNERAMRDDKRDDWKHGLVDYALHADAVFGLDSPLSSDSQSQSQSQPQPTTSTEPKVIHRADYAGYTFLDELRSLSVSLQPSAAACSTTFDKLSGGLLKGLDWSNVFVAGGMVLSSLLCVSESDIPKFSSSDIDIYIYGLGPVEANKKIQHLFDVWKSNLPPDAKDETLVVKNSRTITFFSKYPIKRVQIVLKLVQSPREVLLNFDLDVCAMGWDGERLLMLPRAARALETGYNVFTMDLVQGHYLGERRASQESRVFKYADKGYGIRILPSYLKVKASDVILEESERKPPLLNLDSTPDIDAIAARAVHWTKKAFHNYGNYWGGPSTKAGENGLPEWTHSMLEERSIRTSEPGNRSCLTSFELLMRHVELWRAKVRGEIAMTKEEWASNNYDVGPTGYDDSPLYTWDEDFSIENFKEALWSYNDKDWNGFKDNVEVLDNPDDPDVDVSYWEKIEAENLTPRRIAYADDVSSLLGEEGTIQLHFFTAGAVAEFANKIIRTALEEHGLYDASKTEDPLKPLFDVQDEGDWDVEAVEWRVDAVLGWQQIDRRIDEVFEILWSFYRSFCDLKLPTGDRARKFYTEVSRRAIRPSTADEYMAFANWLLRGAPQIGYSYGGLGQGFFGWTDNSDDNDEDDMDDGFFDE